MEDSSFEYKCPKCNCKKIYVKQTALHAGIYCSNCNAWIKWANFAELKKITNQISENIDDENMCIKTFHKYGGVMKMRCSFCNILLYSSDAEPTAGQFSLVNAKFCPNCGKKFFS